MVATRGRLAELTLEHLALVAVSLGFGVLVALPLAFALERTPPAIAETAIRFLGVTQTIPSLALLGFLVPLLGIGVAPTLFALWLYSLFPIVRNAYSGLRDADPMAVLSATALGMTEVQVLRRVRLPLAASTIMAGIRTAAVINVGTATLAAFIGAGGLGEPIIAGVQLVDSARILSGAIPAAVLALLVDLFLQRIERWVRPRGLAVAPRPDLSLDASEAP
jgi:osmoprotectant transport system permease protein